MLQVGPYGTLSPIDSDPAGPVGPYVAGGTHGTLSPFFSDPAGPVGPYVAGGPVGPYGTLSALASALMGPVAPTMSLEVLPLSDLESADPVMLGGGGVRPHLSLRWLGRWAL